MGRFFFFFFFACVAGFVLGFVAPARLPLSACVFGFTCPGAPVVPCAGCPGVGVARCAWPFALFAFVLFAFALFAFAFALFAFPFPFPFPAFSGGTTDGGPLAPAVGGGP